MFSLFNAYIAKLGGWFQWAKTEEHRQWSFSIWSFWSVILAIGAILGALFDFGKKMVAMAVAAIANITLPSFDLSMSDATYYLRLANTFLPVEELLGFVVLYIALLFGLYLVRFSKWIKSWAWAG